MVKRHRFEWQGVECDTRNDNGVFIAKGWVVACDPQEVIFYDRLVRTMLALYFVLP